MIRLLLLALLAPAVLAAQQADTIIFRRPVPVCVDSTAVLVRELLNRPYPTHEREKGIGAEVRRWGPLVLTGLTLIAVLATRPNRDVEDEEQKPEEEDDLRTP